MLCVCWSMNTHSLISLAEISAQHTFAVLESVIHEGEHPESILNEKRQQITALPALLLLLSIYP